MTFKYVTYALAKLRKPDFVIRACSAHGNYNLISHQLNPKNGPVFVVRDYLGIQTVSCRLLLRIASIVRNWNLKTLGPRFQVLMLGLQKTRQKNSYCSFMEFF